MKFQVLLVTTVLASSLPGAALLPALGTPSKGLAGAEKVDPAVLAAFQEGQQVPVIASLFPPSFAGKPTLGELQENASDRQARVVADVSLPAFDVTHQYSAINALAGVATSQGLAQLADHPDVAAIGLDLTVFSHLEESVSVISADAAQVAGFSGNGVSVAVLDSGIDSDHPDLTNGLIGGSCLLDDIDDCPAFPAFPAEDDRGHGTHVSGIISSDGILAGVGVSPAANVYSYKVLDSSGQGAWSGILAALNDIITNHGPGAPLQFDLVNMSFGDGLSHTDHDCAEYYASTEGALALMRQQGTISFASSGNSGYKSGLSFPACLGNVVSVGAVYDDNLPLLTWTSPEPDCTDTAIVPDKVACGSQSSNSLDLLAPGALIRSDWPFGSLTSTTFGTSMAAPHAVGVAALLMQSRPDLNPDEVESRLKLSGAWVRDDLHDASSITHRWTQRVDARVALLVDDGADFDGDGCPNGKEFQIAASSQGSGGLRNPLNEWDYFNPTGDGMNRVDDILAVVNQYFDDVGTPGYNPGTDRTPLGPNDWNLGPPNGIQRVDDILAAVKHYFHDCS